MSQSFQLMNSDADPDVMVIGDVPAASSGQGTFAAPTGPIRPNIARGRSYQAPQGRSFPYPSPRTRGTTNLQTGGASQRANRQPTFADHHSAGMLPYNYASIQAAQARQAQEAEMKQRCEEGKAHCQQEILKLKPKIIEIQGLASRA